MRSKQVILFVVPALLAGCNSKQTYLQDVYDNQVDCAQDWGAALCSTNKKANFSELRYLGPQYCATKRAVLYKKSRIEPRFNTSQFEPIISKKPFPKNTTASEPLRCGFGSKAASTASSGHGFATSTSRDTSVMSKMKARAGG